MNKLVAVLKKMMIEMLMNDKMKADNTASLNKKINIPMVSEKMEGEFISAVVGATFAGIADALEGDTNTPLKKSGL